LKAGAVVVALALAAGAPNLARAQADQVAPTGDDPSCAAYQQPLLDAARSPTPGAFAQAVAAIPADCPNLKKQAEEAADQALRVQREEDSTEDAYHPRSDGFDGTIRGQTDSAAPEASADSAASSDQASQPPPTEPPGSYDAPPSSGDDAKPAQ
jgi:hypothetical protein